ncbi:uncharacterized protein LOC131603313 [Vicia villosa]|uniref:uncharacterized protein LOC131603313 n=1 Tax=Vicia villosa TaxID=3911 RepID=UPI00273CB90C|nr:uncharacterized protein LOC131603313 [Vicia villosa]
MTEANNLRDARRRKRILQQGSDRLAFIQGRIQTLPPPDLPHATEEEEYPNSVLQNHVDTERTITQTPIFPEKQQTESEILSVPNSEIEPEHVQESQPLFQPQPPTAHQDSSNEISLQQTRAEEPRSFNFINPSDVTNAIDASRFTRLCCSIIVALLVVASYLGFSLIKTVISFRPLYLVLLTNSSFVVAKLFTGKQRGSDERSRRKQNSASDTADSSDQYAQLAKTLEIGMVLKTVADAVFMDCAVYAIVLICSLSLVQH